MTEPEKKPRKGAKRGPKEERLVITEDPATALDKLLGKAPPQDSEGSDEDPEDDEPGAGDDRPSSD